MFIEPPTGLEPHPYLELPCDALTAEELVPFMAIRKQALLEEKIDPLRCGFELPIWGVADEWRAKKRKEFSSGVITELNLGGNRSSKSKRAAKRVMQACLDKPGSIWWCGAATEAQSRATQQKYIEEFLPAEWKPDESGQLTRKKSKVTKVRYSLAGGFTDNNLILPNRSEIHFKFYEMDIDNLPGVELDGFWADELFPFEWIEVIRFRLTNRNGILHITFTPEKGWSQTVGFYLEGARTIESKEAELAPKFDEHGAEAGFERLPRIVQPRDQTAIVVYFWSEDNAFWGNYEGVKVDVRGKSKDQLLMRAYGYVTKAAFAQFPLFNEDVHVLRETKVKEMFANGTTQKGQEKIESFERYHLVDPCPGRNWFMLWVACFANGKRLAYREWPSHGYPGAYIEGVGFVGEWATAGNAHDGVRGEAQDSFGFGLERYKEEILAKEGGEEVIERWIDARYANSPQQEREGTTTLVEQMAELNMDFRAATAERSILNVNDGSIDMINSALYYDANAPIGKFHAKLARINEPMLFISENCPNTIYALKNWTGKDGQKGAAKDPIDCLRMLFLSQIGFLGKEVYCWKR